MQNMVLTRGNGQIWLGTSPVVLQFILVFFHIVVCNCLFAKNIRSHSDIEEMKEYFRRYMSLKMLLFYWERSLTCDLGSLWLLSNRPDSLVTSVPFKVRTTRAFAQWNLILAHLQHSKFDIVYASQSPFETFQWLCLHGCEIACALKQTFTQCKIFLQRHCWSLTSRTCVNTLINETNVEYEATALY